MGDVSQLPTTIRNLEVPDRLYVEGTAEFTQGTTNDSVKTKLVFSDPADDLDIVGHSGVLGSPSTTGIKLSTGSIGLYADSGLTPVAVVNADRLAVSWVENDENGLKGSGGYIAYDATSSTIHDGTGGTMLFSGDTVNAGKIWGKYANTDIATDQGDLGVGHGGARIAPNAFELFDGSLNEWNAQMSGNVFAVTTVSGPSTDKGGGANLLYLKAKQADPGPAINNGGVRVADTNCQIWDGSTVNSNVSFQTGSILSTHSAYGFLQESALGSYATGPIVWGPPAGTGTLSVTGTPSTLAYNLSAGDVDGFSPLQNGIYQLKGFAVGNLINASIRITINGTPAANSATAGANFLNLSAQWTGFLNAGDICRLDVVTATVAKDGASFEIMRMQGNITDVVTNGTSHGPL
jgi:hypothetical protein